MCCRYAVEKAISNNEDIDLAGCGKCVEAVGQFPRRDVFTSLQS